MTESVRYVIQEFGGFFNMWMDRDTTFADKKWYTTLEEAKKDMATPEYRKSRVIKRVITEEIVVEEKENKPPKPKFKAGDTVKDVHDNKRNSDKHFIVIEIVADSYWTDGYRWNYRLKGVNGATDTDPTSSWREYELKKYTPKEK